MDHLEITDPRRNVSDTKAVPLTKGYSAIVDSSDYDRVAQHRWHAFVLKRSDGSLLVYAKRNTKLGECKASEYMHREILQPDAGQLVDHIDGNGLNNCRANLRHATRQENARNMHHRPAGQTSAFKGVYWYQRGKKWVAQITNGGKAIYLGRFVSEVEASAAYDAAAKELYGAFARLNNAEAV
jgi:hypothetical protein